MKKLSLYLFCGIYFLVTTESIFSQIENHAVLTSPQKEYIIRIIKGEHPEIDQEYMEISHYGKKVARYPFEGELVNAYLSPSKKYVAINNHSGIRGWWIWVISLEDGRIIRSTHPIKNTDTNYDRYLDSYDYKPDLFANKATLAALESAYPKYESDSLKLGYITMTYGWKSGDILLLYNNLTFDRLAGDKDSMIQMFLACRISKSRLRIIPSSILAKRLSINDEEKETPKDLVKSLF
ncbi:MAG: hypothetical protein ABI254_09995 [Chthoniobacterales bacterium]